MRYRGTALALGAALLAAASARAAPRPPAIPPRPAHVKRMPAAACAPAKMRGGEGDVLIVPPPATSPAAPPKPAPPKPSPKSSPALPRGRSGEPVASRRCRGGKPRASDLGSGGADLRLQRRPHPPTGTQPSPSSFSTQAQLTSGASLAATESLIGTFQIPPFLLPIYQAAGIQYDVPWQVLAAINWIETDYGRDLSVSSAGAVGWMQFMPSTWVQFGVDVSGDGVDDPYDPVDAIFAAARYLHAAGASRNLSQAIYAYNHALWYVQSVLLRADLIGSYPAALIDGLTGLMQARFPVAGSVQGFRHRPGSSTGAEVFARPGSPAVAVAGGTIVKLGHSRALGRYLVLTDEFGNRYTYAGLGRVADTYAVPRPVPLNASEIDAQLRPAITARPRASATNVQPSERASSRPAPESGLKLRLFAYPLRPASYASGGMQQVALVGPREHSAGGLTLAVGKYTRAPLRTGASVIEGTILGRVEPSHPGGRGYLTFVINPAGPGSPSIDPVPILRSWQLSDSVGIYGSAATNPVIDPGARDPTVGQILLMSKERLEQQVLADRGARIYKCGRRDIRAGLVDRRVLAAIEYLTALGLRPTVSGLVCGQGPVHANGASFEISRIDDTPVLGHQGPASPAAMTIRALLALQGTLRPTDIISLHSYPGEPTTLALPDHTDRVEVDYASHGTSGVLDAHEWSILTSQLSRLTEPTLAAARSTSSTRVRQPEAAIPSRIFARLPDELRWKLFGQFVDELLPGGGQAGGRRAGLLGLSGGW